MNYLHTQDSFRVVFSLYANYLIDISDKMQYTKIQYMLSFPFQSGYMLHLNVIHQKTLLFIVFPCVYLFVLY